MALALAQAKRAAALDEVPVGAILVQDQTLIAKAHNRPVSLCDPCAHAEILVLRAAGMALCNYRLPGSTMYVTLEPCAMCAGAIVQARVARLVYAASDPKAGAAGSVLNLFAYPSINHHTQVQGGVCAAAAMQLLQDFFSVRRQARRRAGSGAMQAAGGASALALNDGPLNDGQ